MTLKLQSTGCLARRRGAEQRQFMKASRQAAGEKAA
jgi:hypothetical protein